MEHSVIDYIIHNDDEMRKKIETSVEYEGILRRKDRIYEKLNNTLNDWQKELMNRLEDNEAEELNEIIVGYFKAGMKLGIRIVAEAMFD